MHRENPLNPSGISNKVGRPKRSFCKTCKGQRVIKQFRNVSNGLGAKPEDVRIIGGRAILPLYTRPAVVLESVWCPECRPVTSA